MLPVKAPERLKNPQESSPVTWTCKREDSATEIGGHLVAPLTRLFPWMRWVWHARFVKMGEFVLTFIHSVIRKHIGRSWNHISGWISTLLVACCVVLCCASRVWREKIWRWAQVTGRLRLECQTSHQLWYKANRCVEMWIEVMWIAKSLFDWWTAAPATQKVSPVA
jgi:hypothetical protein